MSEIGLIMEDKMDNQNIQKILSQYNNLYKEIDEIYHMLARYYGISDCALWILYIIRELDENHTQNKICEMLSLSKQTVNSALKKLEKEGYIKLEYSPGNQKNKLIQLTDYGKTFTRKTIDNVIKMEKNVFSQFSVEERTTFLGLFEKYVRQLQIESKRIIDSNNSENNIL